MPGNKRTDPVVRFWRKVQKGGADECWLWTGSKAGRGYGQFYDANHVATGAHRFSWQIANGRPVPDGMHVMHMCDNPPCVNPAHLRVGTCADNHRDKSEKGRNPGNRTHAGGLRPKWTPEVVAAMRSQGLTFRQIGDALGVSAATALRTLRRL